VIYARPIAWVSDKVAFSGREGVVAGVLKKITVSQLEVGMFVQRFDGSWLDHPFWSGRFPIKDLSRLRQIQQSGLQHCWIDLSKGCDVSPETPHGPAPPAPPSQVAQTVPRRETQLLLSDELQRAARLRALSAQAMRRLFTEVRLGNAIQVDECISLVDAVVESVNRHPHALLSLARLKTADEYTYVHSVAVCALMVCLGRQLALSDHQCREAGMAGMLHDVGKAAIPLQILNKPGKLTPAEFDVIKQHPLRGHEMLLRGAHVSEDVMDVCRHHHERIDGTGYPDSLLGDRISLFARMGAICDVYDAVTSDRPYKTGWDPAQALSQMATWDGHFDPSVFQSFVKSVGIYPTGSLVRMRSGRLAVVLDQNPASLTKPQVKVFFSTKANSPLKPEVLNLASPQATDQITAREPPESWNFPYLNELWGADSTLTQARGQ
jgi:HD-GYP domain-containing protein (c-di-GMP phosphodiesterase class II)